MPNDAAWVLSPNNPYQEGNAIRPWEPPEPAVLTMRDVDRMVAARLADARREAAEAQRRACAGAWEEGRHAGYQRGEEQGREQMRTAIKKIVGGRLIHIDRRLRDRGRANKTTIAAERAFGYSQAEEVAVAVKDLEAL